MISKLSIQNVAIIDKVVINFHTGLNILTGPTGSGKSIMINSISYLLGSKFNKNLIRTNKDEACIEGEFIYNCKPLILKRKFYADGTSKNYINEKKVTLKELRSFGANLVDMHGQHEHQYLLDNNNHIKYIDSFGTYDEELEVYRTLFKEIEFLEQELNLFKEKSKLLSEQMELYKFQYNEINQYEITKAVESEITSKHNILANSKQIKDYLSNISELIGGDDKILNNLDRTIQSCEKLKLIDGHFNELVERFKSISIEVTDIFNEITSMNNKTNIDKDELLDIEKKLSHFEEIKRKYGGSIESVNEYNKKIASIIQSDNSSDSIIKEKINIINNKKSTLNTLAHNISDCRCKSISEMESLVYSYLENMDMSNVVFQINNIISEQITINGIDDIEFFISTNKGEKLKPLINVISGGELSRLMIAIKLSLNKHDAVNTLIFDEVDSGISGSTAEKVGKQILELSNKYQILCISHLSQIASKGKVHFNILKHEENGRTCVSIEKLDKDRRINTIASLLSGLDITVESIAQAEKMLRD